MRRRSLRRPEGLTIQLRDSHPKVLIKIAWALRAALRELVATVFDWLVEIVKEHPNVELLLIEIGSDAT